MANRRLRILFVVAPGRGHLNVFLGIAQRLEAAGHELAFFCNDDISAALKQANLRATVTTLAKPKTARRVRSAAEFTAKVRNPSWYRSWIAQLTLGQIEEQIIALTTMAETMCPDLLCIDPFVWAGAIVAERLKLPWAAVATGLIGVLPLDWRSPLTDAVAALESERDAVCARHGVRIRFWRSDAVSPWLNIVFTTEALIPRALSGNDFSIYVGPSTSRRRGDEQAFPWEQLDAQRPFVYVSAGSQYSFPVSVYTDVHHALAATPFQCVMVAGDQHRVVRDAIGDPRAIVVDYAPQIALLERAAAMVTHGGANSVLECLARGKPLLAIPITSEQALQARLVSERGVGVSLPLEECSRETLAARLSSLLSTPSFRERAELVRASYAGIDGTETAANLLVASRDGETERIAEPIEVRVRGQSLQVVPRMSILGVEEWRAVGTTTHAPGDGATGLKIEVRISEVQRRPGLTSPPWGRDPQAAIDALGAAIVGATPLKGGTSIAFLLRLSNHHQAGFKPAQVNPQTVPRKDVAAYRLGVLLEEHSVPPCRMRQVHRDELLPMIAPWVSVVMRARLDAEIVYDPLQRTNGVIYPWIPELSDSKLDTARSKQTWLPWLSAEARYPAEYDRVLRQISRMLSFDYLINNADRFSGGNILTDSTGTLYFMDNSFSFDTLSPTNRRCSFFLNRCERYERRFIDRVRAMNRAALIAALDADLLSDVEINGVLERGEELLAHVDGLVAKFGHEQVFFPDEAASPAATTAR